MAKRKETAKQLEARLTAFERDFIPAKKPKLSYKARMASWKIMGVLADYYEYPAAPTREVLTDILTDIHHFARTEGQDLEYLIRMAEKHAEAEK
jgi:hypothetical protein